MKEIYLILDRLLESKLKKVSLDFKRFLVEKIDFKKSIIGIYGERGIGKTYLMLQRLKQTGGFYFSLDNPIVRNIDLFKFIDFLVNDLEYKYIYIDEIHKNFDWINVVKTIYDYEFDAKIIFSGSSSLDLYKGSIDLGRRGKFYNLHTINYFEFLNLFYEENNISLDLSLEKILENNESLSLKYGKKYSISKFDNFIKYGFYPFGKKISFEDFVEAMQEILKKVIVEDLPTFKIFKSVSLINLQKIFYFIANNKPSELSFLSLSKKVGVDKKIIEDVLFLLNKIGVISLIPKFGSLTDIVRKEYKVFLGNPNLYYIWANNPDIGTIRESFFISQVRKNKNIEIFSYGKGDFLIKIFDKEYIFEIGGKNKTQKQIKGEKNAYIVKDGIIVGNKNIIPLWVLGLISI